MLNTSLFTQDDINETERTLSDRIDDIASEHCDLDISNDEMTQEEKLKEVESKKMPSQKLWRRPSKTHAVG